VIKRKIMSGDTTCILTPISLKNFLKNVVHNPSEGYNVLEVLELDYIYDFKSAIAKYIDPKIKGHQVLCTYLIVGK
jgi:hypothetical protein